MNRLIDRLLRSASLALLGALSIPHALSAQATPAANVTVTITLMVPVQVKDLNPGISVVRLWCSAQPVGGSSTVTFNVLHPFGDAGPVVDGAYSGTAKVVLTGTSSQSIPSGQQWSYNCHSSFMFKTSSVNGVTPGNDPEALLAPGSGSNLVQGTFTTQ